MLRLRRRDVCADPHAIRPHVQCRARKSRTGRIHRLQPARVRLIAFCFSAFFAGNSRRARGDHFEIMNAQSMGAQQSGFVLLMAFVGGVGAFLGPIIGAILITFLQITLSDVTSAWQLYFGLLFILIVLFSPGGVAGWLMLHAGAARGRMSDASRRVMRCRGAVRRLRRRRYPSHRTGPSRVVDNDTEETALHLFGVRCECAPFLPWVVAAGADLGRRLLSCVVLAEGPGRLGPGQRATDRKGRSMSGALPATDYRKSFGATPIIRGVDSRSRRGRTSRHHRSQRRWQVDAVSSHQRTIRH